LYITAQCRFISVKTDSVTATQNLGVSQKLSDEMLCLKQLICKL